jgi:hypothetical protein
VPPHPTACATAPTAGFSGCAHLLFSGASLGVSESLRSPDKLVVPMDVGFSPLNFGNTDLILGSPSNLMSTPKASSSKRQKIPSAPKESSSKREKDHSPAEDDTPSKKKTWK